MGIERSILSDPFLIEGPAILSISGGRTSGYMLWRILQAHGGKLPDDVRPIFANTGKEMPETLDFVREMSERWNVPITWLEFCRDAELKKSFAVVDYESASRNGEPFALLNDGSPYLPNPVARMCTVELKILTIERYLKSILGWVEWDSAIGMRADEPLRVKKIRDNPSGGRKGMTRIAPLADAKVQVSDIGEFWKCQEFDLRLPNMNGKTMHGNCDLCFLKGANQIMSLIRENPARAIWWIKAEASAQSRTEKWMGARFRKDRPSYQAMYDMATKHGELFAFDDEPLQDCMCVD